MKHIPLYFANFPLKNALLLSGLVITLVSTVQFLRVTLKVVQQHRLMKDTSRIPETVEYPVSDLFTFIHSSAD